MARIEIVPGSLAQVHQIIDELREIDRIELTITSGNPGAAILAGWEQSAYRRVVLVDESPAAVYGVVPTPLLADGSAAPWMVATPAIEQVSREFLLSCPKEIEAMRQGFTDLRNATHKDNTTSINWLRWLGFRVSDEPVGPGGVLRMFSMLGLPSAEVKHV
jgi:hypothetical protein